MLGERRDDGVPVDLAVGRRMEAAEVMAVLQQAEAESREGTGEGRGIVGPGGREEVVLGAGGPESEIPRLVEVDVQGRQTSP